MKYWHVAYKSERDPFGGEQDVSHFWVLDDGATNYRVGNSQGPRSPIERSATAPGDLVVHYGPESEIALSLLAPGEYHPRIYRPTDDGPQLELPSFYNRTWSSSFQAVRNLLAVIENLFRYLEPHPDNAKAYGHEQRQLLILACTEVESSCKAVLKANAYPTPPNDRWSTRDYVKVAAPMHLREWEIGLRYHPEFPPFKPFENWNTANPTTSLSWYDAYNAVKHDREDNFKRATLQNAIVATGAAYLMVHAQFGQFSHVLADSGETFWVSASPKWPLSEFYVPPEVQPGASWTPVNHTF
jgi:hypothetical protein